jgi:ribonucleoside-diphosphate reductase beta chain
VTEIALHDPQTLYRHWEAAQWSPFAVDLSRDIAQWPAIEAEVRSLLMFVLASLMVAEERITTKFSGLVGAHGSEEEATFLATQQVDEARHTQFYARFRLCRSRRSMPERVRLRARCHAAARPQPPLPG